MLTNTSHLEGKAGHSKIRGGGQSKYNEHHYIFQKWEDINHSYLKMKQNNKYFPKVIIVKGRKYHHGVN